MNFVKFLRTPFLQNIFRRLLLLRLKCKLKLWLQNNWIYTSVLTKPPHLKQHHCNNGWEFKILQQMSSEYLLFTSAYQNWLLLCKTGNKWHMCKSVYIELSGGQNELFWDAWLVPFFSRKIFLAKSLEKVLFWKTRKNLTDGFFPKLYLHYIYLD